MNRHVRNHVRHMFYNDYNRRHPRRKSGFYWNNSKSNDNDMDKIHLVVGAIALIVLLILSHFFKTIGIVFAVITFLFGLWPVTILLVIATAL